MLLVTTFITNQLIRVNILLINCILNSCLYVLGWEEKQIIGASVNTFIFNDLNCGTYHQFYLIAYNVIGKGDPSQVVATKTKGSGKNQSL